MSETNPSIGIPTTSNALRYLWEKSADRLSNDELKWFADLNDKAGDEADELSRIVMGIGCLIGSDKSAGNFQSAASVAGLMFNLSHQLDTIAGLAQISTQAQERLDYPAYYKKPRKTSQETPTH